MLPITERTLPGAGNNRYHKSSSTELNVTWCFEESMHKNQKHIAAHVLDTERKEPKAASPTVLNLGLIELQAFSESVAGIRQRLTERESEKGE